MQLRTPATAALFDLLPSGGLAAGVPVLFARLAHTLCRRGACSDDPGILGGIRMPPDTVRLSRITGARVIRSKHVRARGHHFKVPRVEARLVPAQMVYLHASSDGAAQKFVGEAVHTHTSDDATSAHIGVAIPVSISRLSFPYPTSRNLPVVIRQNAGAKIHFEHARNIPAGFLTIKRAQ